MGYPADLLSTRTVIKPGLFAVIPRMVWSIMSFRS